MRKLVLGCVVSSTLIVTACGGSGGLGGSSPCELRKEAYESIIDKGDKCLSATDKEKHRENVEEEFKNCQTTWDSMTEAAKEVEQKAAEGVAACEDEIEACEEGQSPNAFISDWNNCKK